METRCSFFSVATTLITLFPDFGGAEERVFTLLRPEAAPARLTPAFSIAMPCSPDFAGAPDGARMHAPRPGLPEIDVESRPPLQPFDAVVKFFNITKRVICGRRGVRHGPNDALARRICASSSA